MIFNAITPEMIDMAALGQYFTTSEEFSHFLGRANRIISSVHNLNRTRESDYIIPRGAVLRRTFSDLIDGISVTKDKIYEFPVYQFKLDKDQLDLIPTANVGTYFTALLNVNNIGVEYNVSSTEIPDLKHDFLSIRDLSFRFVSRYNYDINQMVFDITIDRDVNPYIEVMNPQSIVKIRESLKDRFYITSKSYIDGMGDQQVTLYLNVIPEVTNDTHLNIIGSFGNVNSPLHILSDLDISFNETAIETKVLRESIELTNPIIAGTTAFTEIDDIMPNNDTWTALLPLYTIFRDAHVDDNYSGFIQPIDNTKYDKCSNVMIAITADVDKTVNVTKDSLEFVYFDTHQKKLCFATNVYMLGSTADPDIFQYQTIQDFQKFVDGPQHVVGNALFDKDIEVNGKMNIRNRLHVNDSISTDKNLVVRQELRILKNHAEDTDLDGDNTENEEHIAMYMEGEDLVIKEVDPTGEGDQVDQKEWARFHDSNDNDKETYVSMFGRKMAERDWVMYLNNAYASIEGGGIVSLNTNTNVVDITDKVTIYLTDSEDNVQDESGVLASRQHTFNEVTFTVPNGHGIFIETALQRDVNPKTDIDIKVLNMSALESSKSLIPVAIRWTDGTLLWVPARKTIPTVHVIPRPAYKHIPIAFVQNTTNWLNTLNGDCSWEIEKNQNSDHDLKVAHEKKTWEGGDVIVDLNDLTITGNHSSSTSVAKTTRSYKDGIRVTAEINDNTNHIAVGIGDTSATTFNTTKYYLENNDGICSFKQNTPAETIVTDIVIPAGGAKLGIEYDGRSVIARVDDVEVGRIRVANRLEFYGLIPIAISGPTKTAHYCTTDENAQGVALAKLTTMFDSIFGTATVTGVETVAWDNNGNTLTLSGDGIVALSSSQGNGQEFIISNNNSVEGNVFTLGNHNDTLIYKPDYNVDSSNGTTGSFAVINPNTQSMFDYPGAIVLARYDSTIGGLLWIPGNMFIPDDVPEVPAASYRNIPSPYQSSTINTYNVKSGECSWITRQYLTHIHNNDVSSEVCTWNKLGGAAIEIWKNNTTIKKLSGVAWDTGVYSHIGYKDGAKMEYVVRDISNTSEIMMGLDHSPAAVTTHTEIEYRIYQSGSSLFCYSGTDASVDIGTVAVGDHLSIEFDGYNILVRKNDNIIRTIERVNTTSMYYGVTVISTVGCQCNDMIFSDNAVGVARARALAIDASIRANLNVSGGGLITWNNSTKTLSFTKRIMAMPVSENMDNSEYIDMGDNVANSFVLSGSWPMLVYRPTFNTNDDVNDDAKFEVVNFNTEYTPVDGEIIIAYYNSDLGGLVWAPDKTFIPDAVIIPQAVSSNVPSPFTQRSVNTYDTATGVKSWDVDRVKNLINTRIKESTKCSWSFSTSLCKVEENDQTISRIGGTEGWNSSAYSNLKCYGGFRLSFRASTTNKAMMIGIKRSSGSHTDSYDVNAYMFYLKTDGNVGIYETTNNRITSIMAYTTNTQFDIIYDGKYITYYIDGILRRSVADTSTAMNIANFAFNNIGGTIKDVVFVPATESVYLRDIIGVSDDSASDTGNLYARINHNNDCIRNSVRHASSSNAGHILNLASMSFAGSTFKFSSGGTAHNLNTYFSDIKSVMIQPIANPAGKLGETYYTISGTTVTIYNSGSAVTTYALQVIGTPVNK